MTPWRTLVFSRREQGWRLVGKRWALSGSPTFCTLIDGWPYVNPGDLNFLVCIHSIPIHDVNFYPLFDFTKYTKSGTFTRVIERWQEQNSKFKYQGTYVGCSSKTATVDVWKSGFCSCKEQESSLTLRGEATPEGVWRQSWGRATWWRSQGRARLLCPRGRMKTLRSPAGSSLDPPVVRSISFADQTARDMGQVEWKKNERGSKEMFLWV